MPKRGAISELNHDNWNQEDEKEEAGQFSVAPAEITANRQKKIAKRRTLTDESGTGGLFKSFSGFSSTVSKQPFSFGGFSQNTATSTPSVDSSKILTTNTGNGNKADSKEELSTVKPEKTYLSQLSSLNHGVLTWINKHITTNPYCDLTPVFDDYKKHLADIEMKYPYQPATEASENVDANKSNETEIEKPAKPDVSEPIAMKTDVNTDLFQFGKTTNVSNFTFSAATANTEKNIEKPSNGTSFSTFTFGSNKLESQAATTATPFSLISNQKSSGTENTSSAAIKGFSFGTGAPLNFGSSATSSNIFGGATSTQQAQEEDEAYEPPKPESREIKEDGATYTKRCKLYYMSESKEWKEKGLGNLHVKPLGDKKVQFIVRADNNLGQIFLNICITKDMTLKVTKNALNLACIPNPPLDPKAKEASKTVVPFLVRVKTDEDAKELLAEIDKGR